MERRRSKIHRRPSGNYAQPELRVDVTVLTQRSFSGSAQPRHFDETDLGELTPHVQAYRSQWPNELVIIVAEVTRPKKNGMGDLYADLKEQLFELSGRRFPEHIIDSVVKKRIRQPYVPGHGGGVRGNVAWVLKYRGGTGVFPNHPEPDSPEAEKLLTKTTWIGAWVGCRESVLATGKAPERRRGPEPPMAVIIFPRYGRRTSYYAMKMIDKYRDPSGTYDYWWRCVRDQPLFLFMDLHRLFNNFKANVATASWEVNKVMEPESYSRRYGVMPRVARLRGALIRCKSRPLYQIPGAPLTTFTVAEIRQDLKTYEIAQKSMEKIAQHHVEERTYLPGVLETVARDTHYQSDRLCDRLYDLGTDLETSNLQVDMLREQCLYLMDSEFNTVAARTDARLGILTVLAFVLTPAGFVVSLFSVIDAGTTQLIISAVLVAFFSVVVYIVVDGLYRLAEQKELPSALGDRKRTTLMRMRSDSDIDDKEYVYL